MSPKLVPGQPVPDFSITLTDGTRWRLYDHAPKYMLMLNFYRGYHCPRCGNLLKALEAEFDEFSKARMDIVSISADAEERAQLSVKEWKLEKLPIGYGLTEGDAATLGLYMSKPIEIRPMEQKPFAEPAIFIVRSDLTLYGAILQTFPFSRPKVADLLEIPGFAEAQKYPPRGDYVPKAVG